MAPSKDGPGSVWGCSHINGLNELCPMTEVPPRRPVGGVAKLAFVVEKEEDLECRLWEERGAGEMEASWGRSVAVCGGVALHLERGENVFPLSPLYYFTGQRLGAVIFNLFTGEALQLSSHYHPFFTHCQGRPCCWLGAQLPS